MVLQTTAGILLSIDLREGLSLKSILIGGLAGTVKVLAAAMTGFKLHPIDDDTLPILESHLQEDGFPQTASGWQE